MLVRKAIERVCVLCVRLCDSRQFNISLKYYLRCLYTATAYKANVINYSFRSDTSVYQCFSVSAHTPNKSLCSSLEAISNHRETLGLEITYSISPKQPWNVDEFSDFIAKLSTRISFVSLEFGSKIVRNLDAIN